MNHPDEISKLAAVQARVDEVKNIMVENIEKVRVKLPCSSRMRWSHQNPGNSSRTARGKMLNHVLRSHGQPTAGIWQFPIKLVVEQS